MNCVKSNTLAQSNTVVMSSPVVHLLPIVALLVAVSAQGFNSPPNVNLPTQEGLTRLFFNARDPQTALACFAGYIGESNLITANYSEEYSRCLTDAQDSRRSLDSRFLPTRNKIDQTVVSVCSALSDCIKVNSTLGSFNCHANAVSTSDKMRENLLDLIAYSNPHRVQTTPSPSTTSQAMPPIRLRFCGKATV